MAKGAKTQGGDKNPEDSIGRGRPTQYKEEYAEQARKLCLLGSTDEDLADFFNVVTSTIDNWKNTHSDFLGAIKSGKKQADSEVASKLFHRATGYEHPDTDIRAIDGQVVMTPIVKHYPPDTAAAIFWLKNRQRGQWRDKVDTEHSGQISLPSIQIINPE